MPSMLPQLLNMTRPEPALESRLLRRTPTLAVDARGF